MGEDKTILVGTIGHIHRGNSVAMARALAAAMLNNNVATGAPTGEVSRLKRMMVTTSIASATLTDVCRVATAQAVSQPTEREFKGRNIKHTGSKGSPRKGFYR